MQLSQAIRWAVEDQRADIVSLSFGWGQEPTLNGDRVITNAISEAQSHCNDNLLIFAAASNRGGSKNVLFPAKKLSVFPIRATNTAGKHEEFNPPLPEGGEDVFGTLGVEVPASNRGKSSPQYIDQTGTSVATAIMAGIAAIVIGYINIHDDQRLWNSVRTFEGFQNLLLILSTKTDAQKRFISLERYSKTQDQVHFEAALSHASKLAGES